MRGVLWFVAGIASLTAMECFGGLGTGRSTICAAGTNSWLFSKSIPAGGLPQRARWDVEHKFDIPEHGAVVFDFSCSNVEACNRFTFYARRGSLWVPLRIEPEVASGETQHIVVVRSDWSLKDLPGGKLEDWSGFDGFRLSAWRATGDAFDLECRISNFAVITERVEKLASPNIVTKPAARSGERRLAWCHRAWGMSEKTTWDGTIRSLKKSGFTDVIPNMCRAGGAYYESKVLPVMPYVAEHGDQLAACLAACRKYGVKCHVWKVCWNIGKQSFKYAPGFVEKMRAEGRLAVTDAGKELNWLCPSHPANRQAEIDTMLELAAKGVDGVHFDYIRYNWMDVCFCARCKAEFEKRYGAVSDWKTVMKYDLDTEASDIRRKWTDFRCENITAVVREVSKRMRKEYPSVEISAAVFGITGEPTRTSVAQDWGLWCREKYVDFVCPMDYIDSLPRYKRIIERQKAYSAGVKCYPGIGISVMKVSPRGDRRAKAVRTAEQVEALREAGFGGFTVFDYTPPTSAVLGMLFAQ